MQALIRAALKELGVDRFILGVHDAAFPMLPSEEVGRGSPYSEGAENLLIFAAEHGFTGIQLGPQGMTHRGSASPYEATLFTKNPLNLPFARLSLLTDEELDRYRTEPTRTVKYAEVFTRFEQLQDVLGERYASSPALHEEVEAFLKANRAWLLPDGLYDALCREHDRPYWLNWGSPEDQSLFRTPNPARLEALEKKHAKAIRRHAFIQYLLRQSHLEFKATAQSLRLQLYADLQIGYSAHDAWTHSALFLSEYRMGAPPSRTNPEGQPWGYFALDPKRFGTREQPGPVLDFVRLRISRILDDYDGVRVDHPHGWIDPWVYRADEPNPLGAVQQGARLRSTPDDNRHPLLGDFSIVQPTQLNRSTPPYADDRVQQLEPDQIDAYALLLDEIVGQSKARGIPPDAMVCEILSTLPNQIAACLERHGLGRFRVTQKARLDLKTDVYRSENAKPQDWIMLGNHDTAPIWAVAKRWSDEGALPARAAYLAERLAPNNPSGLAKQLQNNRGLFVHAQLADALASPARNLYIFFTDLFGYTDVYNTPGTISDDNWSLRLPSNFEAEYRDKSKRLEALNLPVALAMALRANPTERRTRLAQALTAQAPRAP